MEELAYLAYVLMAGAKGPRGAFRAAEAAEAALATVALGAALSIDSPTVDALAAHFEVETADLAFRRASLALASHGIGRDGVLLDRAAVRSACAALSKRRSA